MIATDATDGNVIADPKSPAFTSSGMQMCAADTIHEDASSNDWTTFPMLVVDYLVLACGVMLAAWVHSRSPILAYVIAALTVSTGFLSYIRHRLIRVRLSAGFLDVNHGAFGTKRLRLPLAAITRVRVSVPSVLQKADVGVLIVEWMDSRTHTLRLWGLDGAQALADALRRTDGASRRHDNTSHGISSKNRAS